MNRLLLPQVARALACRVGTRADAWRRLRIVPGLHPRLWAVLLLPALLTAAVDGTVSNLTTGNPQQNATVTLYKLGEAGMDSLQSVKSAPDGRFTIDLPVAGPHLIQTAFDGVTYNHMLPPGSPTTGLKLEVYNSANRQPAEAKVMMHFILLQPGASQLTIRENIIFSNTGKVTFNNPDDGTLRLYVDKVDGRISVRCTAPQGLPIERAAEKTSTPGVYKVDFPIKPGETQFDVTYGVPFTSPGIFAGKILHGSGKTQLVTPQGVKLVGDAVELAGQEQTRMGQVSIYSLMKPEFRIEVEGTGTLTEQAAPAAGEDEEETGAGLRQIRPRVYDRFLLVLGLAMLIFFLGFLMLFRRGSGVKEAADAAPAPAAKQTGKGKRRG